jgi:hypothetical protein
MASDKRRKVDSRLSRFNRIFLRRDYLMLNPSTLLVESLHRTRKFIYDNQTALDQVWEELKYLSPEEDYPKMVFSRRINCSSIVPQKQCTPLALLISSPPPLGGGRLQSARRAGSLTDIVPTGEAGPAAVDL